MKIKETIERECCDVNLDLFPYFAKTLRIDNRFNPRFCKHCGQLWVIYQDAGELDGGWTKVDYDLLERVLT